MSLDLNRLRRHYASLSDEGLLEIDREELVEAARECLDAELASRGLADDEEDAEDEAEAGGVSTPAREQIEEDWSEDAATVFSVSGGSRTDRSEELERACEILDANGIPHDVNVVEDQQDRSHPYRFDLLVPGKLLLEATSILDRDFFNAQLEDGWRDHFASLDDDELAAVDIQLLTAGWTDRIERLKRAYREERTKRG